MTYPLINRLEKLFLERLQGFLSLFMGAAAGRRATRSTGTNSPIGDPERRPGALKRSNGRASLSQRGKIDPSLETHR